MSYTVLARRYRSATFDEVIGQDHVAGTLKKAIESGRIAHAYLFCGTRGVGKTSMARILAKALNCENADAPTPTPCNKCNSCVAIARGDDIDVIEIDAASNRGIDNIRDLISNAQYRPARARFKIYIIDEVHGLLKDAFNALLKVLEEPPGHVKFILATTEPEKVLPTILSRCQRYDFRNIPTREIAGHLMEITKQEKIKADEDALLLVAKAGAGSMRDSLSLLDRLLSIGEKQLNVEMIENLLGLPRSQLLFNLSAAIGGADVKSTLAQADSLISGGLSPDSLVAALVDHLRNLLILRTCGADCDLVEVPGLPLSELQEQSERFDVVALTQDITLLEELRRNMRQSQAGRALLDATLVRMALSDQFASIGDLLSRLENGESAPAKPARPPGSGRAPMLPMKSPAQAPAAPVQKKKRDEPEIADSNSVPLLADSQGEPQAAAAPAAPSPEPLHPDSNVEPVSPHDLPQVYKSLLDLLSSHGPGLHSLLSHGRLVSIEDGRAVIRYGPQHETFVKMLERNGKKDLVSEAITRVLKQSVGVRFEVEPQAEPATGAAPSGAAAPSDKPARIAPPAAAPASPSPTPAPDSVRITPELIETIRANEPLVKALMDQLGATIVKVD